MLFLIKKKKKRTDKEKEVIGKRKELMTKWVWNHN